MAAVDDGVVELTKVCLIAVVASRAHGVFNCGPLSDCNMLLFSVEIPCLWPISDFGKALKCILSNVYLIDASIVLDLILLFLAIIYFCYSFLSASHHLILSSDILLPFNPILTYHPSTPSNPTISLLPPSHPH